MPKIVNPEALVHVGPSESRFPGIKRVFEGPRWGGFARFVLEDGLFRSVILILEPREERVRTPGQWNPSGGSVLGPQQGHAGTPITG